MVEASGRDRPGLLQALARHPRRQRPVHPVRPHRRLWRTGGRRLLRPDLGRREDRAEARKITALKADLLAALEQNEAAPNTPGLKRARASVAR